MTPNKDKAHERLGEQLARVWRAQCAKEELTALLLPKPVCPRLELRLPLNIGHPSPLARRAYAVPSRVTRRGSSALGALSYAPGVLNNIYKYNIKIKTCY